jgi:hypothetical protein
MSAPDSPDIASNSTVGERPPQEAVLGAARNGPSGSGMALTPAEGTATALSAAAAPPEAQAAQQRAEQMVDHLGERTAQLTSSVAMSLRRFLAHVREFAQDIWADAQNIRRGGRS